MPMWSVKRYCLVWELTQSYGKTDFSIINAWRSYSLEMLLDVYLSVAELNW